MENAPLIIWYSTHSTFSFSLSLPFSLSPSFNTLQTANARGRTYLQPFRATSDALPLHIEKVRF